MPKTEIIDWYTTISETMAESLANEILSAADPTAEPDFSLVPEELRDKAKFQYQNQEIKEKKKTLFTVKSQTLQAVKEIQRMVVAGELSEEEGTRKFNEFKEKFAMATKAKQDAFQAKSAQDLKKIAAQGSEARAGKITEGTIKETLLDKTLENKKAIKEGEQALARELPSLKVEAETAKVKAKSEAKINEAEFLPIAAARGQVGANQELQRDAIKLAQSNYHTQHAILKHALKVGDPIPTVSPAALAIMEPGGFRVDLENAQQKAIIDAKRQLSKLTVQHNLIDPVALQPLTTKVDAGQKITVEDIARASSTQKAVGTMQEAFLKQGIKVGEGGASLLKPPMFGASRATDAANTGIKEILSLIQKTGTVDPKQVASIAQAAKGAGGLGGLGKAGLGVGALFLLSKLFGGGQKTPEMTPEQQLMLSQQMQEQQQKAALVQSLIQQRNASSENDMAKAMLMRMQMMQGQGGGGGVL